MCLYIQGNFFQNIGSITLFAVIGTAISAFIVGGGIFFLGQVRIVVVSANNSGTAMAQFSCSTDVDMIRFPCCNVNNASVSWNVFFKADVIYKMTMTDR